MILEWICDEFATTDLNALNSPNVINSLSGQSDAEIWSFFVKFGNLRSTSKISKNFRLSNASRGPRMDQNSIFPYSSVGSVGLLFCDLILHFVIAAAAVLFFTRFKS